VNRPATARSIDLDVVRAVALIGVCVMNYHGYLNPGTAGDPTNAVGEVLDPWRGPLSSRFAATFVVVAGMGVVLLTRRAVASGDPVAIAEQRWVLVRRGVLLLSFGFVLDWVWPGTILFFYGGYFLAGAAVFTLSTRWLVALGAGAAVAATAIRGWAIDHPMQWLLAGEAETSRSPRGLVFDLVVRGTHPLLPWLAFLCLGMVLQRHMPARPDRRVMLAFAGVLAVIIAFGASTMLPVDEVLRGTWPYSRSIPYVVSAGGTALVAVLAIGALARATSTARPTRWLAVAGRCTLSLYLLHVVAFRLVVDTLQLVEHDSGVTNALTLALGFWLLAIATAVAWNRVATIGPLEWAYRRFSDSTPVTLVRPVDRR
jgi:uncharacterized membrane protein YeiB